MKLSITSHRVTVTIEIISDEVDAKYFVGLVRQLMLAMGYHPDKVNDALGYKR